VDSEAVNVRMTADALKSLDAWRRQQEDLPGRPEAIRRLVEIGRKSERAINGSNHYASLPEIPGGGSDHL
jgi:hypothetical protein